MQHNTVGGGGGVRLHVMETGNPVGQPILFIHGFSQCLLAWSKQLDSPLARDHRLVAMDMRGHGMSEKPRDAYADTKLWADDVNAIIRELELERPVLCGWSYGTLPIFDYVRHYGEEQIGGYHLVDALSKLGSEAATAVITPELLALVPGLFSTNAEESVRALEPFVRMCFAHELSVTEFYTILGYNTVVPPYVRQALFSRVVDNDDILSRIRKPVLITHGALEAVVKLDVVEQHRAKMPHAQVDIMPDVGHSPFYEAPDRFNERLAQFCEELASTSARHADKRMPDQRFDREVTLGGLRAEGG
jgi:pimeloyl-ACP methyl ester carboxylesterase